MAIHPVIMAGGSGTRFWPLSRRMKPKQFLPLASGRPLLVETFDRLGEVGSAQRTWVVCGRAHADEVRRLLPQVPGAQVLVEPMARNTAPAIGLAAVHVAATDPSGVLLVLPSDHHVAKPERFREALAQAAALADEGFLATIGIQPTRPDTGYGYIELGERRADASSFDVARFVEKPDRENAEKFVQSGRFVWNAGIFAFRADVVLEEIRRQLPGLHGALQEIASAIGTDRYDEVLADAFPRAGSISIDHGVMEKAERIACVPGDFGWSDVGSFAALPEVRKQDQRGNVADEEAVLVDCDGCVVLGSGRPIAAVGLKDLVIVDAGDSILVVPKDRAQDVRKAVDALVARKREDVL